MEIESRDVHTIAGLQLLTVLILHEAEVRIPRKIRREKAHRGLILASEVVAPCIPLPVLDSELLADVHLLTVNMGHHVDIRDSIDSAEELVLTPVLGLINEKLTLSKFESDKISDLVVKIWFNDVAI